MDKEFTDKLDAISEWKKEDNKYEKSDFSVSYSDQEDGFVLVEAPKGSFEYRLKPIGELFSQQRPDVADMSTEDPRSLHLLHAIESSIKRLYIENAELTDASVMLALDKLSMKLDAATGDEIIKRVNRDLRLLLSMSDYSRDDVKWAVRKIPRSVKRHNAAAGVRGYLDFIMEYVP